MMDLSLFKSLGSLKEFVPRSPLSVCHSLPPLSVSAHGLSVQGAALAKKKPLFFCSQINFQSSCAAARALMPAQTRELEHTIMDNREGRTAALSNGK